MSLSKFLIVIGLIFIVMGSCIWFMNKYGLSWRLPGDIVIERGNFKFMFPLATCLLISVIVNIILRIVQK